MLSNILCRKVNMKLYWSLKNGKNVRRANGDVSNFRQLRRHIHDVILIRFWKNLNDNRHHKTRCTNCDLQAPKSCHSPHALQVVQTGSFAPASVSSIHVTPTSARERSVTTSPPIARAIAWKPQHEANVGLLLSYRPTIASSAAPSQGPPPAAPQAAEQPQLGSSISSWFGSWLPSDWLSSQDGTSADAGDGVGRPNGSVTWEAVHHGHRRRLGAGAGNAPGRGLGGWMHGSWTHGG